MEQVCISIGAQYMGIVGAVVVGTSAIANFLPAPDATSNKVIKLISRIIHFVAVDITTAVKK